MNEKTHETPVDFFAGLPDIAHEPRFSTHVLKNVVVVEGVLLLSLERPRDFTFTPGHYVWLVLPERSSQKGAVDRRAYSIASGTGADHLELLIRVTGSDYLADVQKLSAGDSVEIIGAMGSAFTPPPPGAALVAGGVGIAPFLSILRSDLPGRFSLYAFEHDGRQLGYQKELDEIAAVTGHAVHFFHGEPDRTNLAEVTDPSDQRPVFISGPQGFVNAATAALTAEGIAPSRLRYESFYPADEGSQKMAVLFTALDTASRTVERQTHGSLQEFPGLSDLFLLVVSQTTNHIVLTGRNGQVLFANHAAETITGYTFAEMRGQTPRLWGGLMPAELYREGWPSLLAGTAIKKALLNRRKDGTLYTALGTFTPIVYSGLVVGVVATEEDISYLQAIDKAKSELVMLASHQLHTPLTIVDWYAEMLLAGSAGVLEGKQKKYVEEIHAGSRRMVDLVDVLLNVSRIELGTFVIEPLPTNVSELARSTLDEFTPQIEAKKLLVHAELAPDLTDIPADPKLLRMIFENLLGNAVKYTPEGGQIGFRLLLDGEQVRIEVSDTGVGIPRDQQSQIFTKLFRAGNIKQKNSDGTGLGLYIVKSILDHSGGRIWFTSSEGAGTTFFVTFPLAGMLEKRGAVSLAP